MEGAKMNKHRLLISICIVLLLAVSVVSCAKTPGIDTSVTVSGVEFQLYSGFYNEAIIPSDPDDVALVVKGEVLSGTSELQEWEVWLTDENGRNSTPGSIMTRLSPNGNPSISWVFYVTETHRSLTLYLPGGQTIQNVDSLIE